MNYVCKAYRQNILLCFAVVCGALLSAPCLGQNNSSSTPMVVIDLNKVFESHPTFRSQIDGIRAKVKAEETKLQQQGEQMKQRFEQLSKMDSGDPQYKKLESETARLQGQIQADMALKRKGFLEEEAKVYYDTYQQVRDQVKAFAESNRIGIVLRYSSDEIDPANRQSVLQGINQPIVYNQGRLDITTYIIERFKQSGGTARTAGATQPQRK